MASPHRLMLTIDAMASIVTTADIVTASLQAQQEGSVSIRLVGDARKLDEAVRHQGASSTELEILHADQIVGRRENGARAIKIKKNTSLQMAVGASRAANEPLISFGNGNALREVVRQLLSMPGRLCPFAGRLTYDQHEVIVLDVGSYVHTTGSQLVQFGLMGAVLHTLTTGNVKPSVGLLSSASSVSHCPDQLREAHLGLHEKCANYVGLVTADQLTSEPPDVLVMDAQFGGFFRKRELHFQESTDHAQQRTGVLPWRAIFSRAPKTSDNAFRLDFRSMVALGTRNVVVHRPEAANAQHVLGAILEAVYFHELDVANLIQTQLDVVGGSNYRTTVEHPAI